MANSPAKTRPPRTRLAASFDIHAPVAGTTILLQNYDEVAELGTVVVRVLRLDAEAVSFLCRIDDAPVDLPDPEPNPLPAGVFRLDQTPGTQEFRNQAVPVQVAKHHVPNPPDMIVPPKKHLTVASYAGDGTQIDQDRHQFRPTPPTITTTVLSRACIWLTFADDGFAFDQAGEYGESVAAGYRPTGLPLPLGCNQVRIEAVGSDQWQHHPSEDRRSGPDGLPGAENMIPLTRPDIYKSGRPGLNSSNIVGDAPLPLNALVALPDRGPGTQATESLVGSERTLTFAEPMPAKLHLGFHDGFEWSNNHDGTASPQFGTITVQVAWEETAIL